MPSPSPPWVRQMGPFVGCQVIGQAFTNGFSLGTIALCMLDNLNAFRDGFVYSGATWAVTLMHSF